MEAGVTFLFSGRYLIHRQICNNNMGGTNNTFYNVGSYGNKRLYDHLKASIRRIYK